MVHPRPLGKDGLLGLIREDVEIDTPVDAPEFHVWFPVVDEGFNIYGIPCSHVMVYHVWNQIARNIAVTIIWYTR